MSLWPGDRRGPFELAGFLGAGSMGEATSISLANLLSCQNFPPGDFYLGRVEQAFDMLSAREPYTTFLQIKAKADRGAPYVDEARSSLGGGRADARASKIGAGSLNS